MQDSWPWPDRHHHLGGLLELDVQPLFSYHRILGGRIVNEDFLFKVLSVN